MKGERVFQLVAVIVAVFFLWDSYTKMNLIDKLVKTTSPSNFVVAKKDCRIRGGSSFFVLSPNGWDEIGCSSRICRELEIGDSVSLYYSKDENFFYFQGDYELGESNHGSMILIWTIFLLIVVMPWKKLFPDWF
jgi:hypothetical protein